MLRHLALIFCAGGLGALSRFGLSALVKKLAGGEFPLGTLIVNMLGCLIFGFLAELITKNHWPPEVRLTCLVGFLGAFTTFSSYISESFHLAQNRLDLALFNVLFQTLAGFFFLYLGLRLAR
ncbi:MAG: fluoride efflux transporter CrcB [Candidatus Adiutrix sp.]|jgi:CrcB protein|nr:fluoride efflux transporter CrcB [Candidatus Adiutrix sp.]